MPYHYQGRTIIDHIQQLNLSDFNKWGYLKNGHNTSFNYSWFGFDKEFLATICVKITISDFNGSMHLSYSVNHEAVQYTVELTTKSSNLKNGGFIWYMVCPFTGKSCRKLHFDGKHFIHRSSISGLYDVQTRSRNCRALVKHCHDVFDNDGLWNELTKKYAKKTYKGKYTKRYAKLLKRDAVLDAFAKKVPTS